MTPEELTDNAIDHILQNMNEDHLSTWEKSFYSSINDQWHQRRKLSDRQKEILGQIWDKQP